MPSSAEDARTLLQRCCAGVSGSGCGESCRGDQRRAEPILEEPGDLTPVGVLHPGVQAEFDRLTGRAVSSNNRVRVLVNGVHSFGAMLDVIRAADTEVLFENFIFRTDAVGRAFAAELSGQAERGLAVRVLHDPAGTVMARKLPVGFLFHGAPSEVRVYNPPVPGLWSRRAGRDHRKLLVADRERMVVGGMCMADAWVGNCIRHCTWRDSAVLVEGPAAADAAAGFAETWGRGVRLTPRAGRSAPPSARTAPSGPRGRIPVRLISDHAGKRTTKSVLLRAIAAAQREVLVTTPYLLPPKALETALLAARGRGVRVEILIPGSNNHRGVGLAMERAVLPFLEGGVRILRWGGPLIHAKTIVIDRRWSLVGSSNLDPLSLHRNAELNVAIHGQAVGEALAALFEEDRELAVSVEPGARRRRVWRALGASGLYRLRRWM